MPQKLLLRGIIVKELANQLNELVNLIKKDGIIDIDDARNYFQNMKKELILKNHEYKIWQGKGKDKRWKTHLPPDHRILAKPTREELIEALVEYYSKFSNDNCTLKTLYKEWLEYKSKHTNSSNYIKRINDDWNRFYINSDIVNIPLVKLTSLELDEWLHKTIKDHQLNKKQFNNMKIIIKQELEYAVKKGIIAKSPLNEVEISGNIFARQARKPANTQVFLIDEQKKLEKAAYQDFNKTNSVIPLAIVLALYTGLRVGEMVALKYSDIDGDYIYVNRMEVRKQNLNEKGNWETCDYIVVEHTKTDAGNRKIYLTKKAREILKLIQKTNLKNGFKDDDYIFVNEKGRIHVRALDYRIRKCCKMAGIDEKSFHKLRKTFISTLIKNNVNIDQVREIVGHEDARTTYNNYCFNTLTEEMTKEALEKALCG